ncbi:unnamed protein product [Phytophthora fragariaefolia]|uniref:Unnamed protein product n=1 Tax=Phytophthora fragariaefolia TaxID=1490495 RepID=A0A9W6UAP0_9STRA|nr:unnamed protein product [Phytophthora fragariaefolia]
MAAPISSRVEPSGTKSGTEGLHGANVVLNGCSAGNPHQQFRQGCRASRSTTPAVQAAVLGAQVRVSIEYCSIKGSSRISGGHSILPLASRVHQTQNCVGNWSQRRSARKLRALLGLAKSGSFRDARTRGFGPWIGAGLAVTGSKAVDRVPGIVDRVAVTTVRAREAEACRGAVRVATTRAGGIGPVWVLATRRRAELNVTTAAEAAATTAADSAGSGTDAGLATEAWVAADMREVVAKPSTKASGAASFSAATMEQSPAVVDAARVGRPSRRGWETTGDETPPRESQTWHRLPRDLHRRRSQPVSKLRYQGQYPLTPPAYWKVRHDAVDDAGGAGVRGIGENGGSDPLGMDASDNTPLSAETAMPEISADEIGTGTAGSDEGTLCGSTLLLTAEEVA